MARNPKHWKDVQGTHPEKVQAAKDAETEDDGQPVTEDLTHERLDAIAAQRHIEVPAGLNKAEKVALINGAGTPA